MSPKKPTDDIVVPERKNRLPRKEITISLSSKKKTEGEVPPPTKKAVAPEKSFTSTSRGGKRPPINSMYIGGIVVALVLLFAGAAWALGGVEVSVEPRAQAFTVDTVFTVPPQNGSGADAFGYVTQSFTKQASQVVPTTERKQVSNRATGRIVIYNDFSSAPQRLIKNTRFETADGLVYRISESVDVPGQKTTNGKTSPGIIEAEVFADEPGDRYNIGLAEFKVPGFKGKPQYDKFYAKSKTPMAGGFVGTKLVADEKAVADAKAKLHQTLTTDLAEVVSAEAPPQSLLLTKGEITFESLPDQETDEGVVVTERAVQKVAFIDSGIFAKAVAKQGIPEYDDAAVSFKTPYTFTITTSTSEPSAEGEEGEATPPQDPFAGALLVKVSGPIDILWDFDETLLKRDLAGKKSSEMDDILRSKHPGIKHAEATFRPLCIRCVFPADPAEIEVETKGKENPAI